jgi:hypothetical protein
MEPITFLATIAPIQSAIQAGGDGMLVKLDIPETQMHEALKILLLKGKVLKVTLEIAPERRVKQTREQEESVGY